MKNPDPILMIRWTLALGIPVGVACWLCVRHSDVERAAPASESGSLVGMTVTQTAGVVGYFRCGRLLDDRHDSVGAIQQFSEAIRIAPNYADAYAERAFCRAKLQDFAGAVDDFTEVIRIDPTSFRAYDMRGAMRCAINDFQAALEDYNRSLALNPRSEHGYRGRGNLRLRMGDVAGAAADLNVADRLTSSPRQPYKLVTQM